MLAFANKSMSETKINPSSNRLLKKNIVLNTVFRILMIAAPFVTAPYVSRVLLSDGVGVFSYTQSLVTYFTMFAALGTVSYGTREIARKRDNKKDYSKSFWEIELISIICSMVSLLAWIVLSLLYTEYSRYLLIFSFCILATCMDISWLYAGLEKYKYTVAINLLFKVASVISIFLFVKTPDDVWIYILIYSSSLFAGNLSMWFFLPKVLSKTSINFRSLKTHFKETLIYFIPAVAISLYTVLDKTLIGLLVQGNTEININGTIIVKKTSEIENGYYEQATKIIDILKAVTFASITTVMCSRANYLYKNDDKEQIKKMTLNTFEITLFLSIGAAFGLIGIADIFVPIFFGSGYDKTVIILRIIAPLLPIICISSCLGSVYFTPAGKRKKSAILLLIGSGVNLLLSAPLIIFFQSIGASIASVVAELVIAILYFIYSDKIITFKEFLKIIWKKLIASVAMLSLMLLLMFLYKDSILNGYVMLLILFGVGFVCYLVVLLCLKDKSISLLLSLFKKSRKQQE